MNELSKGPPVAERVGEEAAGQRIDNYLVRLLKGVPRSRVYRMLRTGEVRVNSRRVDATYRLQPGDRVRIPPVRVAEPAAKTGRRAPRSLGEHVLLEDADLLILDKPAGVAVHGGSGVASGVVEAMREQRPESVRLELVHRLDKETSGVLILAKRRSALTDLHRQLREGQVDKRYLALVKGRWRGDKRAVSLPLHKAVSASGERRVSVREGGQEARTVFHLRGRFGGTSLLEAELLTGRTHQIRVHLAHLGHPIAGDDKYGDFDWNRQLAGEGLKRMFLHASAVRFRHPRTGDELTVQAPLPADLQRFLEKVRGAPEEGEE